MKAEGGRRKVRGAGWFVLYLAAVVGTAAFLHFRSPNLVDPDALYHFRHAALYAARGPLLSGFPWTTCSVVGHIPGDLWYGFHLLLTPFTAVQDPVFGIRLAGVFVLASMMLLAYVSLARLDVVLPYLWPFVLLFSSQPGLMRLVVLRPHVLSTGFLMLLLSFLVRGEVWQVALTAFAMAFIHLNLVWVAAAAAVAVLLVEYAATRRCDPRKALGVLAGLTAGWLLRPAPLGAAQLLYVQLIRLAAAKMSGVPLLLGGEFSPADPLPLLVHFAPLLLLWLAGIALLLAAGLRRRIVFEPYQRTLLWSALLLSILFFEMTVVASLRASDQWKAFVVMLVAACATAFGFRRWGETAGEEPGVRKGLLTGGGLLLAVLLWLGTNSQALRWAYGTVEPHRYQAAAEWLRDHSPPDSVVFHVRWGAFPDLFFWNQHNRYINGMDPTFMYAYNEPLYWKVHHLAAGQATRYTCARPECGPGDLEETYDVLVRDAGASYLFLEKEQSPALLDYAGHDPRFRLRFEDDRTAVFEVTPPGLGR